MKRQLEQQSRDLTERRRQFEEDKRVFEREYQEWMEKMESQPAPHDPKAGLVLTAHTVNSLSPLLFPCPHQLIPTGGEPKSSQTLKVS